MIDIFHGSVTSYDEETGQYYIRLRGSSLDTQRGVPARTLSPLPYEDGSGIKSAPIAPTDSQCLVFKNGNRYYILGFISPHGIVAHGDVKPTRTVNPGDTLITHSTPSKLGILANGSVVLLAAKWASAALNPITQQFTAWFRNIRINLYSAIVEYFADVSNKKAKARITMAKWVNSAGLPISPPDGSLPIEQDHFTLQAGSLDDDHILELFISQKYKGENPQHASKTLIGLQQDGTYLNHTVSNTAPDGSTTDLSLLGKNDGSFTTRLAKTGGNNISTTIDASDDTGKPGMLIDLNGKTQVSISKSGDVTITTPDGATIKLGGTGNEQALATKTFVEQYYANHIHSNGNQGAPTGTPMTPVLPPVSADASSNVYTFTTKAE
jgi:hypothetical protein